MDTTDKTSGKTLEELFGLLKKAIDSKNAKKAEETDKDTLGNIRVVLNLIDPTDKDTEEPKDTGDTEDFDANDYLDDEDLEPVDPEEYFDEHISEIIAEYVYNRFGYEAQKVCINGEKALVIPLTEGMEDILDILGGC